MLAGCWYYLASSITAIAIATCLVIALCLKRYHRNADGTLSRQRIATVFLLSATIYTFGLLFSTEIVFHGPPMSELIENGFGGGRIAWLLSGVILEYGVRLWDEFRPTS